MFNIARVVLQIAVHRDQYFAACVLDAGGHGRGLSVVATKMHDPNSRILAGNADSNFQCPVPAAVVYKNHLEGRTQRLHGIDDRCMHPADVVLFIVEGHDD